MKTKFLLPIVSACIFAWATPNVLAANSDAVTIANSAPMSTMIQNLQAQGGFITVYGVKFDDGAYRAFGVNGQGQGVVANINPMSGNIVGSPVVKNPISMLQAVKAVEAAGYKHVFDVKMAKDEYKMTAFDPKGAKTDLIVDSITGKVSVD